MSISPVANSVRPGNYYVINDAVHIPCVPGVVIKPCALNYKSKLSLDLKPRVPP